MKFQYALVLAAALGAANAMKSLEEYEAEYDYTDESCEVRESRQLTCRTNVSRTLLTSVFSFSCAALQVDVLGSKSLSSPLHRLRKEGARTWTYTPDMTY